MAYPVYYRDILVAEVAVTEGDIVARYSEEWRAWDERFSMSLSLPLSAEPLSGQVVLSWLANLLPEGEPGQAFRRSLGVAQGDILGQIEKSGGDLAGALRFGGMRQTDQAAYRKIGAALELERIINELPKKPFLVGDEGVSMSLAGAQDKLPVAFVDGCIAIPVNGAASTHILKPDNSRLTGSVANEALCMTLARHCGLTVAPVTTGRAGAREYLLVERYDRTRQADGVVARLHQEDFCQALGRSPSAKYENNQTGTKGPSIADMVELIRQHMTAVEVLAFLDAVIFNIAIGNVDSHAKNYSIMLRQGAVTLAPLYDLMSGLDWDGVTQNHAQPIGGQNRGRHISKRHWKRMAKACGLAEAAIIRRVKNVCQKVLDQLPAALDEVRDMDANHAMLDVLGASIARRASLVLKNALNDPIGDGSGSVSADERPRETY
jgi:serine/threonine-protein kinase HipA